MEDIKKDNDYEEQNNIENNEEHEENSINVYDDNAYMLGEDDSDNENNSLQNLKEQNEENDIQYNLGENNNTPKENEIEGLDEVQNDENQDNQDYQGNEENNNYLKYVEQKNNLQNDPNIENQNQFEENNNNIDINNKNLTPNENQNYINNQKDNNNYNENEIDNLNENIGEEGEEHEEGEDENLPLVTLKYISVCQCCKNAFDSKKHLPYLFKCGHFFCKECIEERFTDGEGIKCPIDGLIGHSIKEFKLLNNLVTDKNIPSQRNNNKNLNTYSTDNLNNVCQIHKGQKLTHIVVNTKEIVCVYCAFDLVRKNPNCEVRELKEKFDEYCNIADKIINLNQNNVEIIQKSLKDIKDNKKREEKKINFYFEHILKYINTKKEEILTKIDSIFTENATKLSQKLENFSTQIELGEKLKGLIEEYNKNNNYTYNDIYESFLKLQNLNESEKNNKINLQEYKFIHDDETKMIKYINCFGDIKSVYKYIPFKGDIQDFYDITTNNNFISDNNSYNQNLYNLSSPQIINKDINLNLKRNENNNYYINNLMLSKNKNKSFILTNKSENLNTLDDDIGNNLNTSYYNNIHTYNNSNLYKFRINSNPKKYINCNDFQRFNKNNNIQINNNMINENNINFMNYNLNNNKGKIYNNYEYLNNNNFKSNKKDLNFSKRTNSNILYRNIDKNNQEQFHRISSPGTYKYEYKRVNK